MTSPKEDPRASQPSNSVAILSPTDSDSGSATAGQARFHFAKRGEALENAAANIDGFDGNLMADRTLLTAEEENKLLRRIDWRLMTLCSIMFLFKNMDVENVSAPKLPLNNQN